MFEPASIALQPLRQRAGLNDRHSCCCRPGCRCAAPLNFSALRRLTQALLPGMQGQGWGRVINFSGSMEPRAVNAATAAKAALNLWSKGLSSQVAARGITVNTIALTRCL